MTLVWLQRDRFNVAIVILYSIIFVQVSDIIEPSLLTSVLAIASFVDVKLCVFINAQYYWSSDWDIGRLVFKQRNSKSVLQTVVDIWKIKLRRTQITCDLLCLFRTTRWQQSARFWHLCIFEIVDGQINLDTYSWGKKEIIFRMLCLGLLTNILAPLTLHVGPYPSPSHTGGPRDPQSYWVVLGRTLGLHERLT